MGGDGPTTFDRVVEYCDGWMPISGRQTEGPSLGEKIATLKRRVEDAGRDPDSITISSFNTRPSAETGQRMESDGVNRVVFSLPSAERDVVVPLIDEWAKFIS